MADIFGGSFKNISKVLDLCQLRHNILTANIANAETPHYKAYDLSFKNQLKEALEKSDAEIRLVCTNPKHISLQVQSIEDIKPQIVQISSSIPGLDKNTVDIDYQMSQMAENTMRYQVLVQTLVKKFAELKTAINEGRR